MKKTVLIGIVLLLFSTPVFAGGYIGGNAGLVLLNDSDWTSSEDPGVTLTVESNIGLGVGFFGGYDFGKFRADVEINRQQNDLDQVSYLWASFPLSGDVTSTALLVNGYYDFHNKSSFTPYVGGGIGLAKIEINDFTIPGSGIPPINVDDTVFAYQLSAGVGITINPKMILTASYRFFKTQNPKFGTEEAEYSSNNFYLGLRYHF